MKFLLQSVFPLMCCLILGLSSAAKMVSLAISPRSFAGLDPVFPFLTEGGVLTPVAGIEAVLMIYCLLGRDLGRKARLVLWLSGNFVIYHALSSLFGNGHTPCRCLGLVANIIGDYGGAINSTMLTLSLGMALLSALVLFEMKWKSTRR